MPCLFELYYLQSFCKKIFEYEAALLTVILQVKPYVIPTSLLDIFPANIYLFKVNNRNTRKRCEIYSKLTIKIPERRQCCQFHPLFLPFLLLTLNK